MIPTSVLQEIAINQQGQFAMCFLQGCVENINNWSEKMTQSKEDNKMRMKLNQTIAYGGLTCSHNGIEGMLEKGGLNPSYEKMRDVTLAKIVEGETSTYVTMNDAVVECCYDHHVITVGTNEEDIQQTYNKMCKFFEDKIELSVSDGDKYTKEYLFRLLCNENGIRLIDYREVLTDIEPDIDDIVHQLGSLVSIEMPQNNFRAERYSHSAYAIEYPDKDTMDLGFVAARGLQRGERLKEVETLLKRYGLSEESKEKDVQAVLQSLHGFETGRDKSILKLVFDIKEK
jgi:hypothetical protein